MVLVINKGTTIFYLNWIKITPGTDTNISVTFPRAFPTNVFSITGLTSTTDKSWSSTQPNSERIVTARAAQINNLTKTGFKICCCTTNFTYMYIALGN